MDWGTASCISFILLSLAPRALLPHDCGGSRPRWVWRMCVSYAVAGVRMFACARAWHRLCVRFRAATFAFVGAARSAGQSTRARAQRYRAMVCVGEGVRCGCSNMRWLLSDKASLGCWDAGEGIGGVVGRRQRHSVQNRTVLRWCVLTGAASFAATCGWVEKGYSSAIRAITRLSCCSASQCFTGVLECFTAIALHGPFVAVHGRFIACHRRFVAFHSLSWAFHSVAV
mmetsp:Transcript_24018/g.38104  ORF Transcript_24018/g.38104 Transcript_24018/m.38104 type:complete len:228 (-) Transcript_24018:60-743(-)